MTRLLKITKLIGLLLLMALLIIILSLAITRFLRYQSSKITSENGIQESLYLEIGDLEQYIQIRGESTNNPIILFLHGGPGFPLSYLSYYFQSDLESDYTFVHWDQRGSGRTYYHNDGECGDLSPELLLSDVDELVDYLCNRFEQDNIYIMGQSWGTVLGTLYTQEHPEKVTAYIGVGQVTDFNEGKIQAAEAALAMINDNPEDVETISNAINHFKSEDAIETMDIKNLETMILASINYLKGHDEINPLKQMWLGLTSPSVTFNDLRWFMNASSTESIFTLEAPLIQYMYFDFDIDELPTDYEVPVYFISGGNDWITPYTMVARYLEQVDAPAKDMVIIEETGHTPFLDQPEKFAEALRSLLD